MPRTIPPDLGAANLDTLRPADLRRVLQTISRGLEPIHGVRPLLSTLRLSKLQLQNHHTICITNKIREFENKLRKDDSNVIR
jgi:hypothetical protein